MLMLMNKSCFINPVIYRRTRANRRAGGQGGGGGQLKCIFFVHVLACCQLKLAPALTPTHSPRVSSSPLSVCIFGVTRAFEKVFLCVRARVRVCRNKRFMFNQVSANKPARVQSSPEASNGGAIGVFSSLESQVQHKVQEF